MKGVMGMEYPKFERVSELQRFVSEYARLKCEEGCSDAVNEIITQYEAELTALNEKLKSLLPDQQLKANEPDLLSEIMAARADGKRKLWDKLPDEGVLKDKLEGALYGRIIGCLMGVPVEGWSIERIEGFSKLIGQEFPPTDYFSEVEQGYVINAYQHYRHEYEKRKMEYAPVDDDIIYTQIALLVMEKYGVNFTTAQMGEFWKENLPYACTAEEVAIENLIKGIDIDKIGEADNPYCQWIGAAIRSDGFGYAAAGYPEKAAKMAYADGYLSHRRNGIYGEMFLAAAQSAAFAVDDPMEALKIGLTEIPANSLLARDLEWAIEKAKEITDFRQARKLVDERFAGMSPVHTNNNLCLMVFGLALGKGDFLKTLSLTVAMGMDNDCTAASAGSIIGAITGKNAVPSHLSKPLNNRCDSYIRGVSMFEIDDMVNRFAALAKKVYEE